MSDYNAFDDLNSSANFTKKPFFAINFSQEGEVLNWMQEQFSFLKKQKEQWLEKAKMNHLRYKGHQYLSTVYYPRDVLETQKKYTPQMVLPLISDAVDEKTARLLEYKPTIVVIPVHDEQQDKVDAKIAKRFLDHIDYVQKLDSKFRSIVKNSKITGESFAWIRWNPDLGDVLPEVSMLQKSSTNENPLNIQQVRQGDVEVVKKTGAWVFYEQAESWDKVNFCFVIELDYAEAMKIDYPHKADQIHEDSGAKVFNFDNMEEMNLSGVCQKIHFYHKKTKYLPTGFEACFTGSTVLKMGPLSYEHGDLPIERLPDIENDEELMGSSFIDKVKSIAAQINNSLNSVVKMIMMAGYTKWFVEAGSINEDSLNNDISIVRINAGSKAPVLAQANPVGAQHFQFIEKLQEWFYQFAKSNSVIRGEPPPGVTAFVALQYLSESESRRLNNEVQVLNQFIRNVYDKCLRVAAQFYKADEKRSMMIMGKDNRWETMPLDVSTLTKDYSVMIQNTSGLSDSKAMRTQQLIDLNTAFPGALPQEQVIEMIGLSQGEKFYDVVAAASRAAEQENEMIQDGKGQIEPKDYEKHIIHWKVHVSSIQAVGFKQKATPEIIKEMELHIAAHEMFLIDHAIKNPAMAMALQSIPEFPIYADIPPQAPLPPMSGELPPEGDPLPQEGLPPEMPVM